MDPDAADTYDYDLPEELVAAHPADRRDASRMMVFDRASGSVKDTRFEQIVEVLRPGDLLVFNDTRVVRARVLAHKATGGKVEVFALEVSSPQGTERWTTPAARATLRCLTRSSKPLRPPMELLAADGTPLFVTQWASGEGLVEVEAPEGVAALLERIGEVPLPPYIVKRRTQLGQPAVTVGDSERYQTVYAAKQGSVAAPTAGLHFTPELLERLQERGVDRAFVTLNVGAGTFRPVVTERMSEHDMHSEAYEISQGLVDAIARAKQRGGRVIAVGTTSVRALEAEGRREGGLAVGRRETDIFIGPGFDFRVVDAMITNFHLPRSTLLALVSAFAGVERVRSLYRDAIAMKYRFYSYGDAMFIQ